MAAAAQIHCAGRDTSFPPSAAEALAATLRGLGREVELHVYEGADHAFANEDRPEVYDPASAALMFDRTVAFVTSHLG